MSKQDVVSKLKNLREKVVDTGVFGATEGVELIDTLLAEVGVVGEPEKLPVTPPPTTEGGSNAPTV